MEAAAEMIVHSARRHFAQREQIHLERVFAGIALADRARKIAKEKIERHRPRKFRRIAETAFVRVVAARDLLVGCVQDLRVELSPLPPLRRLSFAQRCDDLRRPAPQSSRDPASRRPRFARALS